MSSIGINQIYILKLTYPNYRFITLNNTLSTLFLFLFLLAIWKQYNDTRGSEPFFTGHLKYDLIIIQITIDKHKMLMIIPKMTCIKYLYLLIPTLAASALSSSGSDLRGFLGGFLADVWWEQLLWGHSAVYLWSLRMRSCFLIFIFLMKHLWWIYVHVCCIAHLLPSSSCWTATLTLSCWTVC